MFTFTFFASGSEVLSMTFQSLDASHQASLMKSARTFFSQNPNDAEISVKHGDSEESAYDLRDLVSAIENLVEG